MMIQSLDSAWQVPTSLKTDFRNFRQSFGNLLGALKSGDQDQITLSGNALQQVVTQFQTDLTDVQQGSSTNPLQSSTAVDMQNLLNAVSAAREAIASGNPDRITTTQSSLQQATTQFQTDLTVFQQANTGTLNQNTTQSDCQNLIGAINSLMEAQKSGNQDQIKSTEAAMEKALSQLQSDLSGPQQASGHHHQHSGNSPTVGNVVNNLLSYLAGVAGYGKNGQSENILNSSSLNLKI